MASFNGRSDWSKAQALLFLHDYKESGMTKALGLEEWQRLCGLEYDYLHARIAEFHKWGYITRDSIVRDGRSCFGYRLGHEGEVWLGKFVLSQEYYWRAEMIRKKLPNSPENPGSNKPLSVRNAFNEESDSFPSIRLMTPKETINAELRKEQRRYGVQYQSDISTDITTDIRMDC